MYGSAVDSVYARLQMQIKLAVAALVSQLHIDFDRARNLSSTVQDLVAESRSAAAMSFKYGLWLALRPRVPLAS
jgi:hypothetical protein